MTKAEKRLKEVQDAIDKMDKKLEDGWYFIPQRITWDEFKELSDEQNIILEEVFRNYGAH